MSEKFLKFKTYFKEHKKKCILIIIFILLVLFFLRSCGNKNASTGLSVSVSPVERKNIEESISLRAPLLGTESVEIVSRLHYEVLKVNVKEGDKVKKGDILAELDTTDLEKEIQSLTDALNIKKATLNEKIKTANNSLDISYDKLNESIEEKQREYESALQTFKEAERNFNNTKILYENNAESKDNYIKAENAYNDAKRALESFNVENGKVVPSESDLKQIATSNSSVNIVNGKASPLQSDILEIQNQERILQNKKDELEDCKIKSSINGTITRVNIKTGRFADATEDDKPMFVIENIDNLEMKVLISEYDIYKVKEGQDVDITAAMIGDNIAKGKVTKISPTGELKSGSTSERVIPATITLGEEDYGLISGITAKAKIKIDNAENVLTVPIETVLEKDDGTKSVFLVDETNKLKEIKVETGASNDIEVELKSEEIKEGDKLVMSPSPTFTDGLSVTISNLPAQSM